MIHALYGNVLRCLALGFALASAVHAQGFEVPPPPSTLVNDYAGLLSSAEVAALEQKLAIYDDSTSTQIAVVILRTLNGVDAADAAVRIGRAWGVGQAGTDNGVVLLVSVDDRELFIATGFGIEAVLTDAQAGRIIRTILAPNFREGRYFAGLDQATDAVMEAARGEFTAIERGRGGADKTDILTVFFVLLILVIVVSMFGRGRGGGPGFVILPGVGSFSGGRSSFGGFSGGGGFGGFGGGGFGGGGAGGGW